jgi:hypothetical protein
MPGYELAQLNIARMMQPLDSPGMADFVANLDRINALAESSPGFVWRLKDDAGSDTACWPVADTLVNLSVWRDVDALRHFAYKTAHVEIMRRRAEWFARIQGAYLVLWWVPRDHRPTVEEARQRLELLQSMGPTADAFSFGQEFPSPVAPALTAHE